MKHKDTEYEIKVNSMYDFAELLIKNGKLLITSDMGENRISLYRKGNNHYMLHFQENQIVKIEKISRNLAHMQFPGLIVQ